MIAGVNLDESEALQALADEKEAEAERLQREADDLRKQIRTIETAGERKDAADTAAGEVAKMEGEYDELKVGGEQEREFELELRTARTNALLSVSISSPLSLPRQALVAGSKQSRTERDELHRKEEDARKHFESVENELSLLEQQHQKAEDRHRAEAAELSKAKTRAVQLDEEVSVCVCERERHECGTTGSAATRSSWR